MPASSWVHLEDCVIYRMTDKAVLLTYTTDDGDNSEQVWVPRSCIDSAGDNLNEGDGPVTVSVQAWFAKKLGIEAD